jgi:hypothetical protein
MLDFQYRHRDNSCYLIIFLKCYILIYMNPVFRQPCAKLFLSKRNTMNYSLIFGFDSELDKPIPVSVLSMWWIYIYMFVGRLLNVKSVRQSEAWHFFTKIHDVISLITGILHTVKCVYCWELLNCLHHSVMDTWTDCIVVSTGVEGKWQLCL